ncbi:MAG: YeiH family protein [Syntrophothermus sp.]
MLKKYSQIIFVVLLLLSLFPFVTGPVALLMGLSFAVIVGNPFIDKTRKKTHQLLQASVVGLGFGMNASVALQAGSHGIWFTIAGIALTFFLGFIISRLLKINSKTSYLISAGTAICGGSAIAAVAPIIDAKSEDTSVSLGVVFLLNSIALFIFPFIGHFFNLSQQQFGLWSAVAIHDTSSVVGAASQYGKEALAVATTIKLTRALWIIPVSLVSAFFFRKEIKHIKIPWFIFWFFIAMMLNTFIPQAQDAFHIIYLVARQGLVLTLFLIGANLSPATLKSVGVRPLIMGVILWIIISTASFLAV